MKQSDEELMARATLGCRSAYALLYSRYVNHLYRYVFLFCKSKETSEEIVQDAFLKIWENREKLQTIGCFKAFVFRTTKNMLLDYYRRRKTEMKAFEVLAMQPETDTELSDSKLIYSQHCLLIQQAISKLPPKRREIVEMRTQEDLSLDEIAGRLAISKSVVKKQLYQGMAFVRTYMHGEVNLIVVLIGLFLYS